MMQVGAPSLKDLVPAMVRGRHASARHGALPALAVVRRPVSNRNQVRCSVSSIQFSIRLAVAMSLCSSHTSWSVRMCVVELLVVLAQLGQHVVRRDVVGVVVEHALQALDVADRADGRCRRACAPARR